MRDVHAIDKYGNTGRTQNIRLTANNGPVKLAAKRRIKDEARRAPRKLINILDALLKDIFAGERGNRDRHILNIFFCFPRSDHNRIAPRVDTVVLRHSLTGAETCGYGNRRGGA